MWHWGRGQWAQCGWAGVGLGERKSSERAFPT